MVSEQLESVSVSLPSESNPISGEAETAGVRLSELNHDYGAGEFSKRVLFDINLELRPGEMTLMTGPSGSGKTTLLSLIGALREVQAGSARIQGQELRGLSERERVSVRHGIGFIFQGHNLFDSLTGLQNVRMALDLSPHKRSVKHQLATEIMVKLGLEHRMHAKPNAMSGGERQRVAIARALVNRPKLILADEPTAALDKDRGREVVALLQHLAQVEGATIIIVTHDNRILDIADRIVNLVDGHIVSNVVVQDAMIACEFLMKCPVFSELSPTMLSALSEKTTTMHCAPDAILFRQGDAGDRFYIVKRGTVAIIDEADTANRVIATRGEGEFFGEAALLTGDPRNATVQAMGDVELLTLSKEDFQATIESSKTFKDQLLQVFFQRQ